MTGHYYVIAFLVLGIIIIQVVVFSTTLKKIKGLRNLFTGRKSYSASKVEVPEEVIEGPVPGNFREFIKSRLGSDEKSYTVSFLDLARYDSRKTFPKYPGIFIIYEGLSSDDEKEKIKEIRDLVHIGEADDINDAVKAHLKLSNWKKLRNLETELFITSARIDASGDRHRILETLKRAIDHEIGNYRNGDTCQRTTVKIEGYRFSLPEEYRVEGTPSPKLTLINLTDDAGVALTRIIQTINSYLFRNKGSVSDFNLIRDIVERNVDAEDDVINNQLPIPLYLGLMGTMVGIIIGVGVLLFVGVDSLVIDTSGISVLLGGVGIAMTSSFVGLLLTVLNTGLFYKAAKVESEVLRNDFYSWIQEELMPGLSKDFASGIAALQTNLNRFNETFASNVEKFSDTLNKITPVISSQSTFISQIKELDVEKMARANVTVLSQLNRNVEQIKVFGEYIDRLTITLGSIESLNKSIALQMDRTVDIQAIASNIRQTLTLNENIIEAINPISREIGERKLQLQNAVSNMDESLKSSPFRSRAENTGKAHRISVTVIQCR